MAAQRLYGVFWTDNGIPKWGMARNGRGARRIAREKAGLCLSMPLPDTQSWDAPTFRVCADRVEGDWRGHD